MRMDRRRCLTMAAAGTVGASVSVRGCGRNVQGADDRIAIGLIGGNNGRADLSTFMRMPDVQIAPRAVDGVAASRRVS